MTETINRKAPKTKRAIVEWTTCEDDYGWHLAQAERPALAVSHQHRSQRWWLLTASALLLLLTATGWLWHQARMGESKIEGDLQTEVVADPWRNAEARRIAATHSDPGQDLALAHDVESEQSLGNVRSQVIDFGEDWAIVQVTSVQGALPYRQTLLYRKGASGWYAAAPTILLWGAPRTLETSHFLFRYHALDAAAVAAAAAKLDTLYLAVVASYGVEPSPDRQIEIDVSPEYSWEKPIQVSAATLQEASPALYLAPAQISEGDILAQAVLVDLLTRLAAQSRDRLMQKGSLSAQAVPRVNIFLKALGLWQLGHTELPLAALYKPTIQWLYGGKKGADRPLPPFSADLCPLHQLWQAAPYLILIPLFCGAPQSLQYHSLRYFFGASPHSLAEIPLPLMSLSPGPDRRLIETETMGLVTVIDYAAMTYGRARLVRLIANASHQTMWETLIPATFGVPMEQFNAGWQAYLRDHYAISASVIP